MSRDESYRFDGRLDQALRMIAAEWQAKDPEHRQRVAPITNAIRAHEIARRLPPPKLLACVPFEPMA